MANNKIYNRSAFTTSQGIVNSDSLKIEILNSSITIAFDSINTTATEVDIIFKASLEGTNETTLDTLVTNHTGISTVIQTPKFDLLGNQYITSDSRTGTKLTFISHNWCDKSTWYPDSARVSNVTMETTADPRVFNLPANSLVANQKIIDCGHCKFSDELDWAEDYAVEVKDNNVIVQEKIVDIPDFASGGKYEINYSTGQVTFDPSYTVTGPVTISYSKSQTSKWELHPYPGTIFRFEKGKIQRYKSISLDDTVFFELYGIKGLDPRATLIPGNNGDLVRIGRKTYRDLFSIIAESTGNGSADKNTPTTPTTRDLAEDVKIDHFTYPAAIDLYYSYGNFLRIYLLNNKPIIGTRAEATMIAIMRYE